MKKLLSVVIVLVLCGAVSAQDGAPDPSKVLAPYVDEFTYAVGVVDLQNIGLDAIMERFARVGMQKDEVAKTKRMAGEMRDEMVRAGGRHVCFALNLDDGTPDNALLVVSVGKAGKAQAVADVLGKLGLVTKIKGDAVLAGKANILEQALARTCCSAEIALSKPGQMRSVHHEYGANGHTQASFSSSRRRV
jgi:hypothetical protein